MIYLPIVTHLSVNGTDAVTLQRARSSLNVLRVSSVITVFHINVSMIAAPNLLDVWSLPVDVVRFSHQCFFRPAGCVPSIGVGFRKIRA